MGDAFLVHQNMYELQGTPVLWWKREHNVQQN